MKAKTDRWSWLSVFQRILFKNSLAASAFLHSWGVVNFWMILKQWGCLPIGKIKEWKKVGFSCSVSLNPKCANEQFGRCHIATLLSTLVTLALIVVVIAKQIPFVPNVNFWLKDSSRLKSFEICRNGKCLFFSFQDFYSIGIYPYFLFLGRSPFEFDCVSMTILIGIQIDSKITSVKNVKN